MRFPAPSLSHNPSFVPRGNVGGTTGNTGAARKGEAANPQLGQLPLFSLLRSSQSVLRSYLPSSASYILAIGSQVPNSWNQRKSRSSRQHPQREASNFRLRRSQNALLLRPKAAHGAANVRSAPAQVGGYGLVRVRIARAQIVNHRLQWLIGKTVPTVTVGSRQLNFLFFNTVAQIVTPEKKKKRFINKGF